MGSCLVKWRRRRDFAGILARTTPGFVFANFLTATIPFRSVLARYPGRVFIHAHGYDCFPFLKKSDGSGKSKHSADYAAELAEVGTWATVVANSRFTKGILVDAGVNAESIVIKTYGVPMPPVRKSFYDGTRPLKVLLLGRLVDFKGPCEAVRSFSEACDLGLDALLTVVGAGPEEDEMRHVIDSSPHRSRITFAGAQPPAEVPGIMAGHDVFLAHSRTGGKTGQMEAFGVAYIEALAQGMPIVGTACGGPIEIVDHGETGFMSAPLDTGEQARNLVRLGDPNLCRELGTNARQVAERRYNQNQERRFFEDIVLMSQVKNLD